MADDTIFLYEKSINEDTLKPIMVDVMANGEREKERERAMNNAVGTFT